MQTDHQMARMSRSSTRVYTGHDPSFSIAPAVDQGTDYLLHVFEDGSREVATRPGRERRDLVWSPPVTLREAL